MANVYTKKKNKNIKQKNKHEKQTTDSKTDTEKYSFPLLSFRKSKPENDKCHDAAKTFHTIFREVKQLNN